ncbi:MAG TPA: S8 family serine peptidase, partial [Blastocatellia bacterium]|nr:S8 family serine peptidase [Blastocatellia bacterium]
MLLLKSLFCSKGKLTLAVIGLLAWQASPLSAIAQLAKGQRRTVAQVDEQPRGQVEYARPKIAPDLEESIEQVATGEQQSDNKQRVIIQLRSTGALDATEEVQSVDQRMRDEMFASEARANEMRAPVMRAKIESLNGRFARSLNQVGLVIADLPISSVRELGDDPDVAYISPDRAVESFGHIENTVGASDARTGEATNLTTCNGTNVGIAVLDSGVDDTHNLTKSTSSHPGLIYSKSYTGIAANRDYFGHGTHVASILAGDSSFKNGAYTGIAYDSKLISLAVLDSQGRGVSSNVVSAIDWCITYKSTYNIRVINMSLGTPPKDTYTVDPLCLAARRAHNAGIVVVAAAGNNGKDSLGNKIYGAIDSPGIDPSVMTVGATNSLGTDVRSDDTITTYSSRGPTRGYTTVNGVKKYDNLIKPDIVAPGNKVIAACSPSSVGQPYSLVTQYPTLKCGTASF